MFYLGLNNYYSSFSKLDLAVGAPYEDNFGAVYLYISEPSHRNLKLSQKIRPSSNVARTGFGLSIARGFDIDNNLCPGINICYNSLWFSLLFKNIRYSHWSPKR